MNNADMPASPVPVALLYEARLDSNSWERAEVEALRNSLRECELFVRMEGLNSEPAAKASEHARALLAQPASPWVNPLAAEVEALAKLHEACDDSDA